MAIETFFPVQDSILLPEAIAERVLPLYGLNRPYACRFYRKGPCDTYQIGTAEGRYFLKVYRHGGDVRYDHDGRATLFDFDNSGNG